ncbi:MAG: nickel insertion protein, partial [Gaiellaceae bacterium]
MKVLYIDAFSGISGDMTVGALLALGVPLETIREQLALLPLHGFSISAAPRHVHGIGATKFNVEVATHGHAHR